MHMHAFCSPRQESKSAVKPEAAAVAGLVVCASGHVFNELSVQWLTTSNAESAILQGNRPEPAALLTQLIGLA